MELEIEKQALALAEALLCGMGVGVIYDLLRPFRHRSGAILQNLLDALFCTLTFSMAFLYGQHTYKGRLGIWELLGLVLGFGMYMHYISPCFLKVINGFLGLFSSFFSWLNSLIKKSHDFLKLCFQKR